jgi:hypothetical protein
MLMSLRTTDHVRLPSGHTQSVTRSQTGAELVLLPRSNDAADIKRPDASSDSEVGEDFRNELEDIRSPGFNFDEFSNKNQKQR